MLKKMLVLVTLLGIIGTTTVFATDTTNALPYLRMGIGARALGMGGAFTSISDDASAMFWNPAGIGMVNKLEIITSIASLSLDRSLNTLGFVLPNIMNGSLGIGIINAGVTGIKGYVRENDVDRPTGDFAYQSNMLIVSYGKPVQEQLHAGINLKIISDSLKDNSRSGFGLDIGVISKPVNKLSLGLKMQDVINIIGNDAAPMSINIGLAYKFFNDSLTLSGDINKIVDKENIKSRIGLEYKVADIMSFGAGVNDSNISFGLGFNLGQINFAYAYVTDNLKVSDGQHISIGYKF